MCIYEKLYITNIITQSQNSYALSLVLFNSTRYNFKTEYNTVKVTTL